MFSDDYSCLEVIAIDSALKKEENFYPQVFLKEFKYTEKEVIRHVTEDIEVFPKKRWQKID